MLSRVAKAFRTTFAYQAFCECRAPLPQVQGSGVPPSTEALPALLPGMREMVRYSHKLRAPDREALQEFLRNTPSTTNWSRVRGDRVVETPFLSAEHREPLRLCSENV